MNLLYIAAQNMVLEKSPLANTNYKFDETGIVIRVPYYEYIKESDTTGNS